MFTQGRIIFTVVFVIVFVIAMIFAYRRDMKQIKGWFGSSWQVLLAIVSIIFIYYIIARFI